MLDRAGNNTLSVDGEKEGVKKGRGCGRGDIDFAATNQKGGRRGRIS